MLAPFSIVFIAHSSLQKCAMHTKKGVYCDNYSTLNLVHANFFSVGNPHWSQWGTTPIISGVEH